jgi:hypothetical protein
LFAIKPSLVFWRFLWRCGESAEYEMRRLPPSLDADAWKGLGEARRAVKAFEFFEPDEAAVKSFAPKGD